MSTPVGQSREQPLQDRHRSSASCTSGARQPFTGPPGASISCSTRARPRVVSFSSRVAGQDGHMTPPAAQVGPALADAGAAVHGRGEVAAVVRVGQREPLAAAAARPATRTSASSGAGPDQDAGVEHVVRVEQRLDPLEQRRSRRGSTCSGSSSLRARPSPCSPDSEPP